MRLVPTLAAARLPAGVPPGWRERDTVTNAAALYALALTAVFALVAARGEMELDGRVAAAVAVLGAGTGVLLLAGPTRLRRLAVLGAPQVLTLVVAGAALVDHELWPVFLPLLVPLAAWTAAVGGRTRILAQLALGCFAAAAVAYVHDGVLAAIAYAIAAAAALGPTVMVVDRMRSDAAVHVASNRKQLAAERAETENRLRLTAARYKALVEGLPLVTYETALDAAHTVRYVSPQIGELAGRTVDEWTSDGWAAAIHPDDRERVTAARGAHVRTGRPLHLEYRIVGANDEVRWVLDEAVIEVDVAGRKLHSRGCLQDITERRELEVQLAERALHDPLTGLPNRAVLLDRLNQWAARRAAVSMAVLYVDLDDFKHVNDRLGHAAGDEVLAEVARRLVVSVRPEDTVARIGGDEFAILIEGADAEQAERVAQRLISSVVTKPISVGGHDLVVAISVGVSASQRPGRASPEVVLNHADMAMYEAKGAGKAQAAVYVVEMGAGAAQRQQMRIELNRALENGEFELHVQPIVALEDERIVGAEALVRWRHPMHGMVPPGKFIDAAIETGQIVPIGRWVMEQAAAAAAELRRRTTEPLWVTFNLSLRELRERDLVEAVIDVLDRHSLAPDALLIEITESAFLPDERPTTSRLQQLRDLGVRLAIDDFGTGYSSLSYLTRVPADVVKLARPFVMALESEGREATLARSVFRLCSDLGLPTVAEGVETPEQRALAQELGCPLGQGYLFAKPMPLGSLLKLIQAARPAVPTAGS